MHKTVMIYGSEYELVMNDDDAKEENSDNLPTQVSVITETKQLPQYETTVQEKIYEPVKTVQKKVEVQPSKTQTKQDVQVQKPVQTVKKQDVVTKPEPQTTTQKVELPKSVQKIVTGQTEKPVQKVITEEQKAQEELILWNKWRSNLQNQIMRDARLPIVPEGVVFRFSFDVDKYGKVSNVHTWSTNPQYTAYAIQYIAPVIRGYQGHSILNFPTGSNRASTTVEGGWKISKTAKFSTPENYNDTEKVIK